MNKPPEQLHKRCMIIVSYTTTMVHNLICVMLMYAITYLMKEPPNWIIYMTKCLGVLLCIHNVMICLGYLVAVQSKQVFVIEQQKSNK